jgi:hypothetical protein
MFLRRRKTFCEVPTAEKWSPTFTRGVVLFSGSYEILFDSGPIGDDGEDVDEKVMGIKKRLEKEGWREQCKTIDCDGEKCIETEEYNTVMRAVVARRLQAMSRSEFIRQSPSIAKEYLDLTPSEQMELERNEAREKDEDSVEQRLKMFDRLLVALEKSQPQRPATAGRSVDAATQWEMCEIEPRKVSAGLIRRDKYRLFAIATGPRGRYDVASSWDIPLSQEFSIERPHDSAAQIGRVARDELVNRLIADGWEPQPSGPYWYSQRFRRRVS